RASAIRVATTAADPVSVAALSMLSCIAGSSRGPHGGGAPKGNGAMQAISRSVARAAIRATLTADAACAPAAFDGDRVTVVEYRSVGGRRRFEEPAKSYVIISMGHGVVVTCHR